MSPKETLTLQALKLKALHTRGCSDPAFLEALLENATPEEKAQATETRNICALVSLPLFDKVEQLCGLLELSKRQFVEMALVDFVAKANLVMAEVDPFSDQE
jgi:hypothetical protein